MWKRLAAIVGGSALTLMGWAFAGVIGYPIEADSMPQMLANASGKTQLFLSELLSRMMAHRKWQDTSLREYQAHRLFHATNTRFNIDSTLEVETTFRSPGPMQSIVVRQDGSAFIREHVFEKILLAESELSSNDQADLIPRNYQFTLIGSDACDGRPCWHMSVKPRRPDKFLIEGDVWLDAEDYAVSRVHGIPSKHVSMWISHAEVDWHFRRLNDAGVWLTDKVESSSDVRLFGTVVMQIRYDYNTVGVVTVAKSGL
ncbi:MAG TPA: hypothetical protein VGK48_04530 [Terriglobia bacterium]|jgi:hypothetical protein